MDMRAVGLFLAAATALLGSPGPGIAALLAVGKSQGWSGGLRYFAGLQIGLAAVVVGSGAGLVSLLTASPAVTRAMVLAATIYLVYLSYKIATAPVGEKPTNKPRSFSPLAGLLLGITNPKAYLAIGSLLASPLQLTATERGNIGLKVVLCVAVIIVVDIVWLWVGVAVGRTTLTPFAERGMNVAMAATILIATAFSF
ncbi:MAG TPA: LysE family transporter [Steroidobacteraceae bacterium]|jgi:threonine/homoserine/homoserine lactone efflux protein